MTLKITNVIATTMRNLPIPIPEYFQQIVESSVSVRSRASLSVRKQGSAIRVNALNTMTTLPHLLRTDRPNTVTITTARHEQLPELPVTHSLATVQIGPPSIGDLVVSILADVGFIGWYVAEDLILLEEPDGITPLHSQNLVTTGVIVAIIRVSHLDSDFEKELNRAIRWMGEEE